MSKMSLMRGIAMLSRVGTGPPIVGFLSTTKVPDKFYHYCAPSLKLYFLGSRNEFCYGKVGRSNQTSQSPFCDFSMVGNREGRERALSYHDDMATPLTYDLPPESLKHPDNLTAIQGWKARH